MQPLKAIVKNGRLVMDEPTSLPEGTKVLFALVDAGDDIDDERARSYEWLSTQAGAGQLIDDEVIDNLLSRR
jgi:hypothetical protein